jgi:hypothetical protein
MEWRKVAGFSKYEVSETGLVRFAEDVLMPPGGCSGVRGVRFKKGALLRHVIKKGRAGIYLRDDSGKGKNFLIHRLVALAHLPQEEGKPFVCHKDGNKTNNHATNLYWGTPKENSLDMWKHGTILKGTKAPANKLGAEDVLAIRACRAEGVPQRPIAEWFGIRQTTISAITKGQNWKWLSETGA